MTKTPSQPSLIMRYYANTIDFALLAIPRLLTLILCALLGDGARRRLLDEINLKIGSLEGFDFGSKAHLDMIFYSDYMKIMLGGVSFCISIGFAYHVVMMNSSWSCTVGQRVAKFMLVKQDDSRLGIWDAVSRAAFSYFAWIFPLFVILNWSSNRALSIVFIILISVWGDLSFFLKRKISVPDLVSGTLFVNGRSERKLKLF